MSVQQDAEHGSKRSSSSLSSSVPESDDDVTIGTLLAEAKKTSERSLGKRLSHLDSIPVLVNN
jgi:hypothetical protein